MNHAKRHFRFVLVAVGFVLVAAGLVAAYWRHYKLAPKRHLAVPAWLTNSEAGEKPPSVS